MLQYARVDALVFDSGWDNQRVVGVVPGLKFCCAFGTQLRDEVGADHFSFPVAAEVPAHHLCPLNAILDPPGAWFEAQQDKLNGKVVAVVFNERVNAPGIGIQNALVVLRQLGSRGSS